MEVTVEETAALVAAGDATLLDCRELHEWETARIEGAALLPMSELSDRAEELRPLAERPVIVYCHHGVRSRHVAAALAASGFNDVRSMAGGIDGWSLRIDPDVPRY